MFSNAWSTPSASRVISTPDSPTENAFAIRGSGSSEERPMQIQSENTVRRSQASTSGSTYAAFGSIRLDPNGFSARARSSALSGARELATAKSCDWLTI